MPTLFFDTETTGRANYKLPATHSSQPDLVQLGAIMRDDDGSERAAIDIIIQPGGWVIDPGAANVHGIPTETATRLGVGLDTAVYLFRDLLDICEIVVAHNIAFDTLIMRKAFHRCGLPDPFLNKNLRCTMHAATPIVGVLHEKPRHPTDFKWPKLVECTKYFFNEGLDNAHSAIADVRACARIYDAILQLDGYKNA